VALAAGIALAGGLHAGHAGAQVAADDTATLTPTATATTAGTGTPEAGVSVTPTATPIAVKPIVHNPTPIAAPRHTVSLPKPVVVEIGSHIAHTGLSTKQALLYANKVIPQLFIVAPTYVPKNWILQLIQLNPAQDQQTPPSAQLQYVPKSLKKVSGAYPSFYVTKQSGTAQQIIYPGVKPQVVTINKGSNGSGVIKGTLIDLKYKNGYEQVHITWTRVTISYDVSSTIGISHLSIKDLLAVAATVQ
jgi:hypothetical protein